MRTKERVKITKHSLFFIRLLGHIHRLIGAYPDKTKSDFISSLESRADVVKEDYKKKALKEILPNRDRIVELTAQLQAYIDYDNDLTSVSSKKKEHYKRLKSKISVLEEEIRGREDILDKQLKCTDAGLAELKETYLSSYYFKSR